VRQFMCTWRLLQLLWGVSDSCNWVVSGRQLYLVFTQEVFSRFNRKH